MRNQGYSQRGLSRAPLEITDRQQAKQVRHSQGCANGNSAIINISICYTFLNIYYTFGCLVHNIGYKRAQSPVTPYKNDESIWS